MDLPLKKTSRVLLEGVYDEQSPLGRLRGCPHVLNKIWEHIRAYWEESYDHLMEQGDYKICFYIDRNAKPAQISKTLLDGLYDKDCPLSMLRGCPFLLKPIWKNIMEQKLS